MTGLLGYLLVGFVVSWVGSNVFRHTSDNSWPWELASVLLWPLTIVLAVVSAYKRHRDHG